MAAGSCLMDFKKERGSATLEGAIVFPLILFIVFLCIYLGIFFYNQFLQVESSAYAVRWTGQHWHEGKSLYEDVLFDFDALSGVEEKKEKGEAYFTRRLSPLAGKGVSGEFRYENLLVSKRLYHETLGMGGENIFYYPTLTGAFFMRTADLTEEMLGDALSYFDKKEKKDEEDGAFVYIVDGSDKATDYKKVYHLYEDCFYLRNGYEKKAGKKEVRGEGFRVCRICLGRKTGLDE